MSFPVTYREVEELTLKQVLQARNARSIARKAGLRSTPGVAIARPRTLIDCSIDPARVDEFADVTLPYQWLVDLSAVTMVRPFASSTEVAEVLYSVLGATSNAYDPGDYTQLRGDAEGDTNIVVSSSLAAIADDLLYWYTIAEEHKRVLRLSLGPDVVLSETFRFTLQAL